MNNRVIRNIGITIILFGLLIFGQGLFFAKMDWPDLWKGAYSGPVIIVLGAIVLLVYKFKTKEKK